MSARLENARNVLLALVQRYVKPANLGHQAVIRLDEAMKELHDAAIEAHMLLTSKEGPAALMVEGASNDKPASSPNTAAPIVGEDGSAPAPYQCEPPATTDETGTHVVLQDDKVTETSAPIDSGAQPPPPFPPPASPILPPPPAEPPTSETATKSGQSKKRQ